MHYTVHVRWLLLQKILFPNYLQYTGFARGAMWIALLGVENSAMRAYKESAMRKAEWIFLVLALASFVAGAAAYPYLPARIASHWNAAGEVNGYMSRAWGVFLFPGIFAAVFLLFLAIPRIDPRKQNIEDFRKYFDRFLVGFGAFFLYIYLITLSWNLGYRFNFTLAFAPAIAALFYLIGMILPRTKPNFFMGIRTPWTLSSDAVWKRAHELGGVLFKLSAVVCLIAIPFPTLGLWFFIGAILASTIGTVFYSYFLYKREKPLN